MIGSVTSDVGQEYLATMAGTAAPAPGAPSGEAVKETDDSASFENVMAAVSQPTPDITAGTEVAEATSGEELSAVTESNPPAVAKNAYDRVITATFRTQQMMMTQAASGESIYSYQSREQSFEVLIQSDGTDKTYSIKGFDELGNPFEKLFDPYEVNPENADYTEFSALCMYIRQTDATADLIAQDYFSQGDIFEKLNYRSLLADFAAGIPFMEDVGEAEDMQGVQARPATIQNSVTASAMDADMMQRLLETSRRMMEEARALMEEMNRFYEKYMAQNPFLTTGAKSESHPATKEWASEDVSDEQINRLFADRSSLSIREVSFTVRRGVSGVEEDNHSAESERQAQEETAQQDMTEAQEILAETIAQAEEV